MKTLSVGLAVFAVVGSAALLSAEDKTIAVEGKKYNLPLESAGPNDNKPPEGFTALFNGKDLTNWKGLIDMRQRAKLKGEELTEAQAKADKLLSHWMVKNGILYYDGKGQSLQTVKDYGNFELMVDWKVGPGGDSGIYLRGQPQVQIWEPAVGKVAQDESGKFVGSGGLYNNQKNPNKPLKAADKPAFEWNTFHIIMKGDKVTIKLNGELVVDNTPLENYWERGKPLPETGPIELQHHNDPLMFKNIYIKELP